jgi:GDP-4-dehydro-6-deoxy-D-mannose reductase
MRCLITGATGFVGRHLVAALRAAGHECVGLARDSGDSEFPVHSIDLSDTVAAEAVLRSVGPDWVFHLAGYADNGRSYREPGAAWAGNLTVTQSLYDAVSRSQLHARILYVSTGLVYGDAGPCEHVCTEEMPLKPASPYAASKAAADLLSYQQTRSPGLDIVRVRPFNQIGPGQSADYAAANFGGQVVAVERGTATAVEVRGDLSGRRDLTDVRDMVKAYIRLMEVGRTGEVYNAGSGRTYRMQDILDRLVALAGVPVTVEERMDVSRKVDTAVSRADIRKLREATGWEPAISLDQTLKDILDDWRRRTPQ